MAIEFSDVARLLSCKEFAEAEGMPMRGGRAVCPFHAGADGYNMAFYDRDGRCYCHKCGKTADVVGLAAAVWHMNQRDAAVELNSRFRLGLEDARATGAQLEEYRSRISAREQRERDAQTAVDDARKEAAAVWAAVNDCKPDDEGYRELLRQARNADVWLSFKKMELQMMTAGR